MAIWTFSGGTTVEVDVGHARVTGDDEVADALNVDLELLRHGSDVSVVLLAPISEALDLGDVRIVDAWARKTAARHRQTVTTDAQLDGLEPLIDPRTVAAYDPTKIY